MKIGVFGSAFDPPTYGHWDAIYQALDLGIFDKILLVPSLKHPFDKNMSDFDTRCDMIESFLSDEKIQSSIKSTKNVIDISLSLAEKEIETKQQGKIYTFDLLNHLSMKFPNDEFCFLCGADNYDSFHKFKNSEYILNNWKVFRLEERNNIRSTLIRNNVKNNISINDLTASSVVSIIKNKKLYR